MLRGEIVGVYPRFATVLESDVVTTDARTRGASKRWCGALRVVALRSGVRLLSGERTRSTDPGIALTAEISPGSWRLTVIPAA